MRVNCLDQEHNTANFLSARTQASQYEVQCLNHEASGEPLTKSDLKGQVLLNSLNRFLNGEAENNLETVKDSPRVPST